MRIGVLALQGAFAAHARVLRRQGHEVVEVRAARDLDGCAGLVLPGGESTVQLRLIDRAPELEERMAALAREGAPVLATCAGLILVAGEVTEPAQRSFGFLDVTVRRNGFGRQLHSSERTADDGETHLVLIRAPRITRCGARVENLCALDGEPVLVRGGNVWGATFHPELAGGELHARVFGAQVT